MQGDGDSTRRADLNDQVHGADINSQLQRGRRYQNFDLSFFQLLFRRKTQPARQAAVVRSNVLFTHAFGKIVCYPLHQPAGIDKHQSGAVLMHKFRNPVVHFVPHFVRRDRPELRSRHLDRDIELPLVADIHNHRVRTVVSSQKVRDFFDWFLCRR